MCTPAVRNILLGIPFIFVMAAPVSAADFEPSVIPKESTDRFLGGVRDFGDGRPSPNILYSTRGLGEAANSPGRAASQGPSVLSFGTSPASRPLGGSKLQGGTLERRTNSPYVIQGGTIEYHPITPYPLNSPWQ